MTYSTPNRIRTSPHRANLGVIAAQIAPAAITIVLWAAFVGLDGLGIVALLFLANAYVCIWQLSLAVVDERRGPVALAFWSFVFIWIVFAGMVQEALGEYPWEDSGLELLKGWALGLLLLALVTFAAGGWYSRRSAMRRVAPPSSLISPAGVTDRNNEPRLWTLLLVGYVLVPLVVFASGGLSARFTDRDSVNEVLNAGGDTIWLFLVNRLPAAIALVSGYFAARGLREAIASRVKVDRAIVAFAAAMALILLLANPFSSSRYVTFSTALAVVLGLIPMRTAGRKAALALALTTGMLVAYPLAAWFKKESLQIAGINLDLTTYSSIDFDGFQMTINSLAYVEARGFSFGEHILSAVAFFVPRSLWPDKALPASLDIAAFRGYSFQNLSLPLWAEVYIDLGVVGVGVFFALFGFVAGRLDRAYGVSGENWMGDIAALFAAVQFGFIRGPLGGSIVFFGAVLVVGVLVILPRGQHARRRHTTRPHAPSRRGPRTTRRSERNGGASGVSSSGVSDRAAKGVSAGTGHG